MAAPAYMKSGPEQATGLFWMVGVLALTPMGVLIGVLVHFARPVPMFDDYRAILRFAVDYEKLPQLSQRLVYLVAAQTGDYKLIFEHALVAVDLAATRHVHFGFLIWAGNLLGMGICWLLWKMFFSDEPSRQRRLVLFLPVVYLWFQMNYVENFDWAMCGLQTFPVIFFSLASLLLVVQRGRWPVVGACVCACLACFSSSNGFLVVPVAGLVYLLRRDWKSLCAWAGSFVLYAGAYAFRYEPLKNVLRNQQTTPRNRVLFYLSFLGGAAENQHRQPVKYGAAVVGFGVLFLVLWAFRSRFYRRRPAACCMAVWVLLSAIPVLLYRLPEGFEYSLVMRYKVYSDLLLIFCYGFLATRLNVSGRRPGVLRLAYVCALSAAVGYAVAADAVGYRFLVKRQERVLVGLDRYASGTMPSAGTPVPEDAVGSVLIAPDQRTLTEAIQSGIYALPGGKNR